MLRCERQKVCVHRRSTAEERARCGSDYWCVLVIAAGTNFLEEEVT